MQFFYAFARRFITPYRHTGSECSTWNTFARNNFLPIRGCRICFRLSENMIVAGFAQASPGKDDCQIQEGAYMITDKKEKPKHLGRGLASLLSPITPTELDLNPAPAEPAITPNFPPDKELSNAFREINVDLISPNPYQPRMVWNEQELAELAESIKISGIIQPIIVRAARRAV